MGYNERPCFPVHGPEPKAHVLVNACFLVILTQKWSKCCMSAGNVYRFILFFSQHSGEAIFQHMPKRGYTFTGHTGNCSIVSYYVCGHLLQLFSFKRRWNLSPWRSCSILFLEIQAQFAFHIFSRRGTFPCPTLKKLAFSRSSVGLYDRWLLTQVT